MKDSHPLLWVTIAFVFAAILVIGTPNFTGERDTKVKNTCISNLRMIDAAEQQWALDNQKTNSDTPTWANILPYLGRGGVKMPICPSGGTYTLGALSNRPKCSIPGHVLP